MMLRQLLILMAGLFSAVNANAVDPTLDWYSFDTDHFTIHYSAGNQAYAEKAAVIAERAHARLSAELNWTPREKTHLVLSDETDFANGYATPLFFNRSVLYFAPPMDIFGLEDFDDWLTMLIVHEYTHVVHLDKSGAWPYDLRSVLGRFALLFPNVYQPAWITEGIATWKETDLERGVGRGQSSMYAMLMRIESLNDTKPVEQVNLPIRTWPAGTARYLYGVYFMRFIAETYGDEKLGELVESYSDNLLPFFVNTTFREVFGKNVAEMWREFDAWLQRRYAKQVTAIRRARVKAGTRVSEGAYRTAALAVTMTESGEQLYYVHNNGYEEIRLMRIDAGGKTSGLVELNSVGSLDADEHQGVLVSQDEFCNAYTIYRDLYRYDPVDNELQRLTECSRYVRAAWLPGGDIIAVKHEAGRFELHRLNTAGELEEVLWRFGDAIVSQIDISPRGENLVAMIWRPERGWNIEIFDIRERDWRAITADTNIAAYPSYAGDGSHILFSYENNGIFNLVRYDIETGTFEQITNEVNGAFQSAQATTEGPVYYIGYSPAGAGVYRLDDIEAIGPLQRSDSRLVPHDYAPAEHRARDYAPWRSLRPRWWFPTFDFSDQRSELGITTAGSDALDIHHYSLSASRDFKLDAFAAAAGYRYADRFSLTVSRDNLIFLNSDGSFNRTRVKDTVSAVFAFPHTRILRQHNLLLAVIGENESDGELAAGSAPAAGLSDNLFGAAWLYNSAHVHPLSISPNDGMNLRLLAEDSDTLNSDYTGQVYTLDWKPYIRTGQESVLAFRLMQGYGTDRPRLFMLGGESTGVGVSGLLEISAPVVFDRRDYPLRGYAEGLPQLSGRRAQLVSAEWRFPIQRNERGIMAPPLGLMQWSGAVFAETGAAYTDSPQTYYSSAGLEINADLNLFYGMTMRARLGYAHGFDDQLGEDRFYLQLGSSF